MKTISDDLKNRIFEHFMSNSSSLRSIAMASQDLFGTAVDYNTIKTIAQDEDWFYQRHQKILENTKDRTDQIQMILDTAFGMLTDPEVIASATSWSSIANVYFSGLTKVGGLTKKESSKQDLQKILEAAQKELKLTK